MRHMLCSVCGYKQKNFVFKKIISKDLAQVWELKPEEIKGFDRRESSFCHKCGCSLRSRSLAEAIILNYPESHAKNLIEWVEWAKENKLSIAEINYCGQLHEYLTKNPGTRTSQYRENTWRAKISNWLKGIGSEDIENLSYHSKSFDLVLHSEVLEHVNNPKKAINECRRILKPGGACIFTIPLIKNRKTKRKAQIDHKTIKIKYFGKPSHHGSGEEDYLVFWEFGGDIIKKYNLETVIAKPEKFIFVMRTRVE